MKLLGSVRKREGGRGEEGEGGGREGGREGWREGGVGEGEGERKGRGSGEEGREGEGGVEGEGERKGRGRGSEGLRRREEGSLIPRLISSFLREKEPGYEARREGRWIDALLGGWIG